MFALQQRPLLSSGRRAGAQAGSSRPHVLVRSVTAERASLDISKMQPLHDRLLVKPMEEEAKTPGGILLPSGPPKANSDAHFGEVVSVGEAVTLKVSPGDVVVYNKYAMAEVEVPAGEVIFVAEKSVLGTLE